jgi:hypothetical protein
MQERFDPESVDLARVARALEATLGFRPVGAIVGRTHLRDAVVREFACSQLEGEQIIDTMVARGFLRQRQGPGGVIDWEMGDG